MNEIENDWQQFCDDEYEELQCFDKNKSTMIKPDIIHNNIIPKGNDLYISTKTIISYLNTEIELKDVFWNLPIIPYYMAQEGIVKKQIKFNSQSQEDLDYINKMKLTYDYVDEYVINHIDNQSGRIKYKLEFPGIQNDEILEKLYTILVKLLTPLVKNTIKLSFIQSKTQTVLINSNFNCGYYLKRDVLNDIFKKRYNDKIRSSYDPCTYPGIQCRIYYNHDLDTKNINSALTIEEMKTTTNITKVSFMIFRTGSVLIVGKCSEYILHNIHLLLCDIFQKEYNNIHEAILTDVVDNELKQTRSSRTKSISVYVN